MCVPVSGGVDTDTPAYPSEWKGDIYCIGVRGDELDAAGNVKVDVSQVGILLAL